MSSLLTEIQLVDQGVKYRILWVLTSLLFGQQVDRLTENLC